ncbi:MAG: TonB-dependent receptor domain-containing protein [Gemmatimonadota bacterium]
MISRAGTRSVWLVVFSLVLLAALPRPAAAQQGGISGTVQDSTRLGPLSSVLVEVTDGSGAVVASTTSGPTGAFRLVAIPAGTYTLRFTAPGWETRILPGQVVTAGKTTSVTVFMMERSYSLNPITVTTSKREEKVLDAPAAVEVVSSRDIAENPSITIADHVIDKAGVDVITTGLQSNYIVARGFNNIFSGAMLTMTDNRIARIPSLRANIAYLNPTTDLDLDRVEIVLGPASALYGPNAANGVLHSITKSPIDDPGASFSIAGGLRQQDTEQNVPSSFTGFPSSDEGLFQGEGRLAVKASEQFGFKVSGQYFDGTDYRFTDPVEAEQRQIAKACLASNLDFTNPACLNFSNGLNLQDSKDQQILARSVRNVAGGRDNDLQRWSFDVRTDIRPTPESAIILSGGRTTAVSSVDLTGLGAAQVDDWAYNYLQGRFLYKSFFGQVFYNKSDNTDTYLLRSGRPLVDKSSLLVAQLQNSTQVGSRQNFIYGFDLLRTVPKTNGTINGQNESDDDVTEVGGYVQSETSLTDRVDLVLAARLDNHSRLENPVFSPRAALVFKPNQENSLRLTYNRAFSTPTSLNLFLDISGGTIPLFGPFRFDVRAQGAGENGFTFARSNGIPMHMSPFAPLLGAGSRDFLPTTTGQLWAEALAAAQALAAGGAIPASLVQLLGSLPAPTESQVGVLAMTLNQQKVAEGNPFPFDPTPGGLAGIQDIARLDPTITNTIEVGYKGLLGDRVLLAANGWYSHITDFISALRLSTPNVFLNGQDLTAYLAAQFAPLVGIVFPDQATANATAATLGQTLGGLPLGVVTVEQAGGTDPALVLAYRNLGSVDLGGLDLSATVLLNDNWEFEGSASFVNKDSFVAGTGTDSEVVPLNAPTVKGAAALRYRQGETGLNGQIRFRHANGFDANSGVFVGKVNDHQVFDLSLGYKLPGFNGVALQVDVQNLFDEEYSSFVGAPSLGRFTLVRLRYDFSRF